MAHQHHLGLAADKGIHTRSCSLPILARNYFRLHPQIQTLARTFHNPGLRLNLTGCARGTNRGTRLSTILSCLAIDAEQHIAFLQTRLFCRATRNNLFYDRTTPGTLQPDLVKEGCIRFLLLQRSEIERHDTRRAMLARAMGVLNERERRIFEARRLAEDPVTLEELSSEFDISRERVRQIEVRAFEKVQEAVQKYAAEQARAVRVIEDA